MEAPNPNPFPEFHLNFAEMAKAAAKGLFKLYPDSPEIAYPSDHRQISERGAAAMLDRALGEPTDGEAYEPDLNSYAEVSDSFLELATDRQKEVAHYVQLAKDAKAEQLTFGWDDQGNYFQNGEAL